MAAKLTKNVYADVTLIQYAKELGRLPRLGAFGLDMRPIAGSDFDQRTPAGRENPYWEIVRRMPTMPAIWGGMPEPDGSWAIGGNTPMDLRMETFQKAHDVGLGRFDLATRYSWAIPSPGDIAWLADKLGGQAVVEIGAGSGYWAWQLAQAGVWVDAYDPEPPGPGNRFNTHKTYHLVRTDDHTIVAGYADRALMICWPMYEQPHAAQALAAYEGDTFVYVGEGEGGCCADDDFFIRLADDWEKEDHSGAHVTYSGIHCYLEIYRRKGSTCTKT